MSVPEYCRIFSRMVGERRPGNHLKTFIDIIGRLINEQEYDEYVANWIRNLEIKVVNDKKAVDMTFNIYCIIMMYIINNKWSSLVNDEHVLLLKGTKYDKILLSNLYRIMLDNIDDLKLLAAIDNITALLRPL
jgi:hypothetical protein